MTATHTPLHTEPTVTPIPVEPREYTLDLFYSAGASANVRLPAGKTWDDVDHWHVKWDTLYLTLKDGTELEVGLDISGADIIDYKRPDSVEVWEDGEYLGSDKD